VNDGKWHSCAAVLDGQGTISLYVDGALSAQGTYDPTLDYTHGQFWRIGADQWNNQLWQVWNGSIDDVRIYDRALSDSEVAQLYQVESVPEPSSFLVLGLAWSLAVLRHRRGQPAGHFNYRDRTPEFEYRQSI
jgi:hypothetical protein